LVDAHPDWSFHAQFALLSPLLRIADLSGQSSMATGSAAFDGGVVKEPSLAIAKYAGKWRQARREQ